jgi:hypothetical protein
MSVRGIVAAGGIVALGWVIGCTGRTQGAGHPGTGDDAADGADGAAGCIDVPLSGFDTTCSRDRDCVTVTTGEVCPGDCLCGGSAINASDQARYQQEIAGVPIGECGCPLLGVPQCIAGTCTICTGGTNDPARCGTDEGDSSISVVDATAPGCVDIPPSTYTTSCSVDSDCTLLPEGQVCNGSCDCGGVPVNVSGQAAFAQLTAGFQFSACPCPPPLPIRCVAGACTSCNFESDGSIGCDDGG